MIAPAPAAEPSCRQRPLRLAYRSMDLRSRLPEFGDTHHSVRLGELRPAVQVRQHGAAHRGASNGRDGSVDHALRGQH